MGGCACGLGPECIGKCQKIPSAAQKVPWRKGRVNTLPRPLGVELELADWGDFPNERDHTYQMKQYTYTVVRDGSVMPSELEMNLHPLSGDGYIAAMLALTEDLHNAGAEVNSSCGLHVHVDGRDFSYWDARRLVKLYSQIERGLYTRFVAPWRRNNHHCRRLRDNFHRNADGDRDGPYDHRQWIERIWQARSTWEIKDLMYQWIYHCRPGMRPGLHGREAYVAWARNETAWATAWSRRAQRVPGHYGHFLAQSRYSGLNVHSWMFRGTWEWRMKEATLQPEELLMWPLLCGWMVHLSTGLRDSEIEGMTMRRLVERMPRMVKLWAREKYRKEEEAAA